MHPRWWAAAVAIAVVMGAPVSAHASEVHIEAIASATTEGQYVAFTAARGERSRVGVRYSGGPVVSVLVQDTAGVQAGAGCTAESPAIAVCPVRRTEFADQWDLGDGNDTLTLDGHPRGPEGPSILDGSGNDVVRGSRAGDSIFDGSGRDRHFGRGGDDTLFSGSGADVLSGGAGRDTVSYDAPLGSRGAGACGQTSTAAPTTAPPASAIASAPTSRTSTEPTSAMS